MHLSLLLLLSLVVEVAVVADVAVVAVAYDVVVDVSVVVGSAADEKQRTLLMVIKAYSCCGSS